MTMNANMNESARGLGRVLLIAGAALIVVGAAGYLLPEGRVHWTALIPAILGLLAVALSRAVAWPMVALVGGVLLCGVALMGGGSALPQLPNVLIGEASAATTSRAATAVVAIGTLIGLARAWFAPKRATV